LALPRPQKIIRPAHTPLKSDFYNKICHKRTSSGRPRNPSDYEQGALHKGEHPVMATASLPLSLGCRTCGLLAP
jgi:hypothetical protein